MARVPTHRLKVIDKSTDRKGTLGAGWANPDGSISIVIDPGCKLEYEPDFVYTLFPVEKRETGDSTKGAAPKKDPTGTPF